MGVTAKLVDKNGNPFKSTPEGGIRVSMETHPPISEELVGIPFREYFVDDAGSNDFLVDGSSVPVDFCIPASDNEHRWVKFLSVKLADAGAKFDTYGALNALTNGVEFLWTNQLIGTSIIHDGIKDNLEWFRFAGKEPVIVDLSGGGADAIVVGIDLSVMFGNRFGVGLRKGSTDKLIMRVRDNLSAGITEHNVIGTGIRIVPPKIRQ